MKYWLVFMLFDQNGKFLDKFEYPAKDKAECVAFAGYAQQQFVNRGYMTQSWCVTDDHHSGRKQDEGIPFD